MTAFSSSINQAEADKSQQSFGILAQLDFTTGVIYITNRSHSVVFAGNTYLAVGWLGRVEGIKEDIERRPNQVRLIISGVDASLLALALTDDYHGRPARLYFAWFNEQDQLIDTPEGPVTVTMSHPDITLGSQNSVAMNCDNEFARWADAKPLLYTGASHKRFWPNDLFFDLGPFMRDKIISWGGYRASTGIPGTGAPGRPPPHQQP